MKAESKLLLLSLFGASMLSGCSEDLSYNDDEFEAYTKAFINRFDVPAEGHRFSVATAGVVTVLSKEPRDVKVLAEVDGEEYMFADYHDIEGREDINFDIPQGVDHVTIYTEGIRLSAKLGDVIDIDNPLASRAAASRADDIFEGFDYLTIDPSDKYSGYVLPLDANYHLEQGGAINNNTGWQLKTFFDANNTKYEQQHSLRNTRVSRLPFTVSGMNAICVMYWHKKADEDLEVGIVYPRDTYSTFTGTLVYMPVYRTDMASTNESPAYILGYSHDPDYMGAGITIDFANKTQKVDDALWNVENYFEWFYDDLFNDNGYLESLIEKQYAGQSVIPNPNSMMSGDPSRGLPAYSSNNPMPFWEAWDAYVYNYRLTSTQKSNLDEIIPLKEYFGWFFMTFPSAHAYPQVTKLGNRKYHIYYPTAQACSHFIEQTHNRVTAFNIVEHYVYARPIYDVTPNQGVSKKYGYYVRNLKTGEITTTLENSSKVVVHYTYLAGPMSTCGYQTAIEMDLNNDGVYDDIVFYANGNPVDPNNVSFTPYTWTIACEDLGNTDDWDFNDLVVQVQYAATNSSHQQIKVWPMAAGGIYPIYLMHTDELSAIGTRMIGTELHRWLGADLDIYNTGETFISTNTESRAVTFDYDINIHSNKQFSLATLYNAHWTGNNVGGFWVMVDKKNRYVAQAPASPTITSFNQVFDDAQRWGDLTLISNTNAKDDTRAPMVICLSASWEWPKEREHIDDAYPGWTRWITDPTFMWYGLSVKDSSYAPNTSLLTRRP